MAQDPQLETSDGGCFMSGFIREICSLARMRTLMLFFHGFEL